MHIIIRDRQIGFRFCSFFQHRFFSASTIVRFRFSSGDRENHPFSGQDAVGKHCLNLRFHII